MYELIVPARAVRFVRSRSVKGNDLVHIGWIRSGREDGNGKTSLTGSITDSRVSPAGGRLDGFQEPPDAWRAD